MPRGNANIKQIKYLFDICTVYEHLVLQKYDPNTIYICFVFLGFSYDKYRTNIAFLPYFNVQILPQCMHQILNKEASDGDGIGKT